MGQYKVQCSNCGDDCGIGDEGRISGPPERCYPPEWVEEPAVVESRKHGDDLYFCGEDCRREWHVENDDPADAWDHQEKLARALAECVGALRSLRTAETRVVVDRALAAVAELTK